MDFLLLTDLLAHVAHADAAAGGALCDRVADALLDPPPSIPAHATMVLLAVAASSVCGGHVANVMAAALGDARCDGAIKSIFSNVLEAANHLEYNVAIAACLSRFSTDVPVASGFEFDGHKSFYLPPIIARAPPLSRWRALSAALRSLRSEDVASAMYSCRPHPPINQIEGGLADRGGAEIAAAASSRAVDVCRLRAVGGGVGPLPPRLLTPPQLEMFDVSELKRRRLVDVALAGGGAALSSSPN